MERFNKLGLEERVFDLKKNIIEKTQECINNYTEESVNEIYHSLSEVWG